MKCATRRRNGSTHGPRLPIPEQLRALGRQQRVLVHEWRGLRGPEDADEDEHAVLADVALRRVRAVAGDDVAHVDGVDVAGGAEHLRAIRTRQA